MLMTHPLITFYAAAGSSAASPSSAPGPASPGSKTDSSSTAKSSVPSATSSSSTSNGLPKIPSSGGASKSAAAAELSSSSTATSTAPTSAPAPKRRESLNGAPRTHKTDGLDFSKGKGSTSDKTRDKCAEMVYDALAGDSDARKS